MDNKSVNKPNQYSRIAIITGASSGIGLGAAVAVADAGAHVVCAARNGDKLEAVVAAITTQGGKAEALLLDIGGLAGADQLVECFGD